MAPELPPSRKSPQTLLRELVAIALVSILVILTLTTLGIYRVYSQRVINDAEAEAVRVGQALIEMERDLLLAPVPGGPPRLAPAADAVSRLDRRLRLFLHPFDIVKIKIYGRDGTIVYSTDPKIIGRVDRDNQRLAHALGGFIDTKLEQKEEVIDLADERKFDVDVVETYLPIREPGGAVVGSFEVYVDVTRHRQEVRGVVVASALLLGTILLAVFGCSFLLVRKGAVRLHEAQQALETMAVTDALTGLANRRQILLRAEQDLARLAREREARPDAAPLSVLLLDVDRFKQCNDAWGHLVGDQVLKEVAARIAGCIRRYDLAGRYGGEEFLVVLAGAGFAEARAIAERIRQVVRLLPVLVGERRIVVTVSIGIACARPMETAFDPVLHRADVGLYLAKERGRDQVAWVTGEGTEGQP